MTDTKKEPEKAPEKTAKPKGRPLGTSSERQIKVVALRDFPGHKKGDTWTVPERKCRDSNRDMKRGNYKPV